MNKPYRERLRGEALADRLELLLDRATDLEAELATLLSRCQLPSLVATQAIQARRDAKRCLASLQLAHRLASEQAEPLPFEA